ncbi:MAG: Cbb3-type cytochrome c oxidase subunit [Porticoccaceae bacterium]|nr:MAG: Cbb3-type cytochrome c oxidase subunit [Porticoccaceae bacterium]
MSSFWSGWVIFFTALTIGASVWLLYANRKVEVRGEEPKTGHVYDGIEEYDNPLPRWWFNLFLLSVAFSVVYLLLYPGLGNFPGLLGWNSIDQWRREVDAAEARYAPLYARYRALPVEELSADPEAMKMARRLFNNHCSQCHGADARGGYGFPNLTDDDWLYGGTPEAIETTIRRGRSGAMPAWGEILGAEGVENVAHYVLSLSGADHDPVRAAAGAPLFASYCAACHGPDGKGNPALGAPNLTDGVWLYGGSLEMVKYSIRNGRSNRMPPQEAFLDDDRIHLLVAYVWGLSRRP